MLREKGKVEVLDEIDDFFVTLQNPHRFADRTENELEQAEVEPADEVADLVEGVEEKLSSLILYPAILKHSNMAEKHLVASCDFVEVSREMSNVKIEEEMEKLLMEPEMTCLAEEDAKHEAFSTRIGRSFTFQKRSHFENEK